MVRTASAFRREQQAVGIKHQHDFNKTILLPANVYPCVDMACNHGLVAGGGATLPARTPNYRKSICCT